MSKSIEKTTFIPAVEVFEEHIVDLRKRDEGEKKSSVDFGQEAHTFESLIPYINGDVCLNDSQLLGVKRVVRNFLLREHDSQDWESGLIVLATYVNSVRNECENCLRKECPLRDEDFFY